MCGLLGVVADAPRQWKEALRPDVWARVGWRGPDGDGEVLDDVLYVRHSRLAVVDPDEEALQPIVSARGVLAFNGEIYNYEALARRYRLSSLAQRSDTWALFELFELLGVRRALREVRGMFALAYFDRIERSLSLARDPFGIKPLRYLEKPDGFLFGSDAETLARWWKDCAGDALDLDRTALRQQLLTGWLPPGSTAWSGVRECLPGELLTVRGGVVRREQVSPAPETAPGPMWEPPSVLEAEAVLHDSVKHHLVADVPICIYLSGGLDSGVIAATASRAGADLSAFTASFGTRGSQAETELATATARHLGLDLEMVHVGPEQFAEHLQTGGGAYDAPFFDAASVPLLALSRRASEEFKVVLTGEGGDEMFTGYRRYFTVPLALRLRRSRSVRKAAAWRELSLPRRLDQVRRSLVAPHPVDAYLAQVVPTSIGMPPIPDMDAAMAALRERLAAIGVPGLRPRDLAELERQDRLPSLYLEKLDRALMRFGMEGRVPMLDPVVAQLAGGTGVHMREFTRTKPLVRSLATQYLPERVATAPKRGFGVPVGAWLSILLPSGELDDLAKGERSTEQGLLAGDWVAACQARSAAGPITELFASDLVRLLTIESWLRRTDGSWS